MIDEQKLLLKWFDNYKREMPWRKDNIEAESRNLAAYKVWVSEIMLQQTKVETVKSYYLKWMDKFPTVQHLAKGTPDEVNSLWAGLGYYSRARNLHKASKIVVNVLKSVIPSEVDKLLKLPGIGKYTAGAISSIAFGKKAALVDGNVIRVFARLFKKSLSRDDKTLVKFCWEVAEKNINNQLRPGDWNQALMELGATICKPKSPSCLECPLNLSCKVFLQDRDNVENYPLPKEKKIIPIEHYDVFVIKYKNKYLMKRRPKTGLLANQLEFIKVLTKTENQNKKRKRKNETEVKSENKDSFLNLSSVLSSTLSASSVTKILNLSREENGTYTHVFSHLKHVLRIQTIELKQQNFELKTDLEVLETDFEWYEREQMMKIGITKSTVVCLNKSQNKQIRHKSSRKSNHKKDDKELKISYFFSPKILKKV